MSAVPVSVALGWIAVIALAIEISFPYLLRPGPLWPHFWTGFLLPVVSFVHAWLPMQARRMRGVNGAGLRFATAALLLMIFQAALGLALKGVKAPGRSRARGWHFRLMIALVIAVGFHVWLD
ncbi:MAG: hypothetical protein ACRD16_06760 [Thermoanaerobaculia bacterium]